MNTITRDELKRRLDKDRNVKLIEVLAPEEFTKYHLPGAVNVPLMAPDFDTRMAQVASDKNQTVVVYCMSASCNASRQAATRLEELGYRNVFAYEGGKEEWKDAGLPIESVAAAGPSAVTASGRAPSTTTASRTGTTASAAASGASSATTAAGGPPAGNRPNTGR